MRGYGAADRGYVVLASSSHPPSLSTIHAPGLGTLPHSLPRPCQSLSNIKARPCEPEGSVECNYSCQHNPSFPLLNYTIKMNKERDVKSAKSADMPPGMAPMSDTREKSIEDSLQRSKEFRDLFPDVDFGGGVIEPTVNLTFDLKVTHSLHRTLP